VGKEVVIFDESDRDRSRPRMSGIRWPYFYECLMVAAASPPLLEKCIHQIRSEARPPRGFIVKLPEFEH
jgi:hypothetical protein